MHANCWGFMHTPVVLSAMSIAINGWENNDGEREKNINTYLSGVKEEYK